MPANTSLDAVVFDLDGTLYCGPAAIRGAVDAVNRLRDDVPCRFLSNNGERRGRALVQRLRRMGFAVDEGDVISSADLVLGHLAERGRSLRVLALTSNELAVALQERGHHLVHDGTAEVIVVGVDRALTRKRMIQGLHAALNGATIIGTNEDPTYPAADGLHPAAGAYVGFFRGMGFEPAHLCGKPDHWAMTQALSQWKIANPGNCVIVGDNLRTDIAGAANVGARSVLVLTGVSSAEDAESHPIHPTLIVESVESLDRKTLVGLAAATT